jgi:signal transduction histidine kinase
MNARIRRMLGKYFDASLPFEVQTFHLLGLAGIAAGIVVAFVSLFSHPGLVNFSVNLAISALAFALLGRTRRTGNYRFGFRAVVIFVFLLAFPFLFFTAGGYRSGMPCFFVFALIFTALMLHGRERVWALLTLFAVYAACCVAAYLYPGSVVPFETELDYLADVLTGVVIAGGLLILVVVLYIRIYNRHRDQLATLDRAKTEFYQNMNHDMRTPLTVISTFIGNADDMLDHGVDTAEVKECLRQASNQIQEMARMVEYSLTVARVHESRWRKEPLDFAALLRSCAGTYQVLKADTGNALTLRVPDAMPMIQGNSDMLCRAVQNLLDNAFRHTRGGEIALSLERAGGFLVVTIADNGAGIDPGLLPRVFERGVSGGTDTGYGLAICKAVVESHGGEIGITSEPGKGTTARFSLPIWRGAAL